MSGIIVAITAVIGALLGIVNTFMLLRAERVRAKVKLTWAVPAYSGPSGMLVDKNKGGVVITVINTGNKDFTVVGVGFVATAGNDLAYPVDPANGFDAALPHTLAPRRSIRFFVRQTPDNVRQLRLAERAYAATSCEKRFYGGEDFLERFKLPAGTDDA